MFRKDHSLQVNQH